MPASSLRKSLYFNTLGALLLVALLLGITASILLWRSHTSQLRQRNEAILLAQRAVVEEKLKETQSQMEILSTLLSHDPLHTQALLDGFTASGQQRIQSIHLLDSSGRIVAVSPRLLDMVGFDMSQQAHIQQLKRSGQPTWSKVFLSNNEEKPTVALAFQSGGHILSAQLSLDVAGYFRLPQGTHATLAITDPDGAYIYHKDKNKILERETFPWFQQMKGSESPEEIRIHRFKDSHGNWICTGCFFGVQGWGIFLVESEDILLAPVKNLLLAMGGTALLFLLVLLPLLFLGIHSINVPLKRLNTQIEQIASGDYKTHIQERSYQEFHTLAHHINAMASSIQYREEELRLANAHLEQLTRVLQEKNSDLEALFYAASHDLRTPLVNITGFSGEIEAQCLMFPHIPATADCIEKEERLRQMENMVHKDIPDSLAVIRNNAARMGHMLKGLLRFSHIHRQETVRKEIDMNTLLRKTSEQFQLQLSELEGTLTLDKVPAVLADPNDIGQVFTYLIDNALKYHRPGIPPEIRISGQIQNEQCVYTVQDNGSGIAPVHLPKIFHLFYRCGYNPDINGDGLGLSMAKRYVEKNGGYIQISSESGVGTRVSITLPSAQTNT